MKKLLRINAYEIIYIAISLATASHSLVASATIFEGNYPTTTLPQIFWFVSGILIAATVDVGQFITAHALAKHKSLWMLGAFVATALASAYFQLFYTSEHVDIFVWGSGVTTYWRSMLQPLIDARIVIVPSLLPVFSLIYVVANLQHNVSIKHEQIKLDVQENKTVNVENLPLSFMCDECGYQSSTYETSEKRDKGALRHINSKHKSELSSGADAPELTNKFIKFLGKGQTIIDGEKHATN